VLAVAGALADVTSNVARQGVQIARRMVLDDRLRMVGLFEAGMPCNPLRQSGLRYGDDAGWGDDPRVIAGVDGQGLGREETMASGDPPGSDPSPMQETALPS